MSTPAVTHVAAAVQKHLEHEGTGHDWQHIQRVWHIALKLASEEQEVDTELVELVCLLHDVDDAKITGDLASEEVLPLARSLMQQAGLAQLRIEQVCAIIAMNGYRKTLKDTKKPVQKSLEAHICADADFLDGMGAIGVARTFTYGGSKGRAIFIPEELPREKLSSEQYVSREYSSLPHFFEKLLKLRTLMHTTSGKAEAERRHQHMVTYLETFFEEVSAPPAWQKLLAAYK
ncbi:MAG: HD domain-containing protein [Proteobacteria bacterium]|nr:HD domain-containing protein [Pseudomonadota bacterium]